MDWKEKALLWFTRAGQFWLAQTVLLYLLACVVAGKPIGPKDYVRFGYHVIQWQPGRMPLSGASYLSPKSDERNSGETADTPHMNFLENR